MMKIRFGIIGLGLIITGCLGSTPGVCRNACERIYGPSECAINRPGITTEELFVMCEEECATAFSKEGSIGSYDPNEQKPPSETPVLENKEQAEAWAECVENTGCEDLTQNYQTTF